MPSISLFAALVFTFDLVGAIPWDGPPLTRSAQLGADWSPAPTDAFRSPLELFRRAGQYPLTVCGFIGGDLGECAVLSTRIPC